MSYFKGTVLIIALTLSGCSNTKISSEIFDDPNYTEDLKIVKRIDWGWVPIDSEFKTHNIEYITIHHGGVEFLPDKDAAEHVRNLQKWSRSEKEWIDIPYHYMIDLEGNIFEARPLNIPGDTNTEYDPTNHALVEVMGNYEIQELNEVQLKSLVDLISFLSKKYNVPLDKIKTHKDYSSKTVCPGKNSYKYFENGYVRNTLEIE